MLSDNMQDMWNNFEKSRIRQAGQLELPFQFDEKGETKKPIYENKELSTFNKSLKKALEYNPKKKEIKIADKKFNLTFKIILLRVINRD